MNTIDNVENVENDYSGYEAFNRFHDITINLPDDLIEEIKKLAEKHPKYGINGVCAFLMWKGLGYLQDEPPLA